MLETAVQQSTRPWQAGDTDACQEELEQEVMIASLEVDFPEPPVQEESSFWTALWPLWSVLVLDWNMALGADVPLDVLASAQAHCGHAVDDDLFWCGGREPSEVQAYCW